MKIKSFLVALLFVPPFAVSAAAEGRMNENTALAQACGNEGCEVPAPTWSAACMTDQGPSPCSQPMWTNGAPGFAAGQISTIGQKHDNSAGRKYNVTRRQPHL